MCENQQTNSDMEKHNPVPPFVWPEPRVLEGLREYEHLPPFHSVFADATSFCGVICDLDADGVKWLSGLMNENNTIMGKIVLILYPACATKRDDLNKLVQLSNELGGRLEVRLFLLRFIENIPFQSLLVMQSIGQPKLLFGPSGLKFFKERPDRVNLVMAADNSTMESWTRWFNWFWMIKTIRLKSDNIDIPLLSRPQGDMEGKMMWEAFMYACSKDDVIEPLKVDPECGDVVVEIPEEVLKGKDKKEKEQLINEAQKKLPTIALNVPKLDPLKYEIERLFQLGELAVIDKTTRIKPLEVPISPRLFGEESQIRSGIVKKQNQYRISIFEDKDQKRINNLKNSIGDVLKSFSYSLGDGVRWVPYSAKKLLSMEIDARNKEGTALFYSLVKDGIAPFLSKIESTLRRDANLMYQKLFPGETLPDKDFELILNDVRLRLESTQKGSILPKLSYMKVSFNIHAEHQNISEWGTAYSLIKSIARYPIDVAGSGRYFERNFKTVKVEDVLTVMDIFDDPRLKDKQFLEYWEQAKKEELPKFEQIDIAETDIKEKCRALLMLIKTGDWEECLKLLPKP